jgi:hypothetical protein
MSVNVAAPELAKALDTYGISGVTDTTDGTVLTSQQLAECLLVEVILNRLQDEREKTSGSIPHTR